MSIHLNLEHIYYRYRGIGESDRNVLDDVSFTIAPHQCIALLGPSGSGKTTLIQHFTGLIKPDRGRVLVDGTDIWGRKYDFAGLRRRIGLVFQFPEGQLFEESVEKDVAFAPKNLGFSKDAVSQRVRQALQAVDLGYEAFAQRSPFSLSAGEKRRVAIAGVLAMNPDMIVFDEPTAGLDPKGVNRMKSWIQKLLHNGQTIVVISHHMDFIASIAGRAIVLLNGKILFDGPIAKLFENESVMEEACLEQPEFRKALFHYRSNLPADLLNATHWEQFQDILSNLKLKQNKR